MERRAVSLQRPSFLSNTRHGENVRREFHETRNPVNKILSSIYNRFCYLWRSKFFPSHNVRIALSRSCKSMNIRLVILDHLTETITKPWFNGSVLKVHR